MSYILDALKKSEKERALGNIPTLETAPSSKKRGVPLSWFVLAVAAVVFVVVGFVLLSMRTSTPDFEQTAARNSTEAQVATASDPTEAAPASAETAASSAQVPAPVTVAELEPSIRNRLPKLDINVLSYSENRPKRFVMIDQNIYKEGEGVGNGVQIEEITKNSVVMSFEGVRFLVFP